MLIDRPSAAVVHRCRSGQPTHSLPKVTVRFGLIGRVCPAGQVTAPAGSSMAKSPRANPPGTAGHSGLGLSTVSRPATRYARRAAPGPLTAPPYTHNAPTIPDGPA